MQISKSKDNIYSEFLERTQAFKFDDKVVAVFSDMIKRSVPGYENILTMTGLVTQLYAQDNTNCYDLGCSIGASTLAILNNLQNKTCHVHAIDNSPDMINQCSKNLQSSSSSQYTVICENISNIKFQNASVVVLNFTLQFIPIEQRENLLNNIYNNLIPGGVLLLSEKIRLSNAQENLTFNQIHHAFKKTQGYSDLEISQKRNALENVLIPESPEQHTQRLNNVGFTNALQWFQCLNFASFICIK